MKLKLFFQFEEEISRLKKKKRKENAAGEV